MSTLTTAPAQSDGPEAAGGAPTIDGAAASPMVARVRLLMAVSALTTLVAIAAVVGVIGYRVYRAGAGAGGEGGGVASGGTVVLPRGARVIAAAVAGDRIAVTLDIGGTTEIRTYDVKTLKETGRLTFAPAP